MIYDKLSVSLLSALATERQGSTNEIIARYLISHAHELGDASIKGIAAACNVGAASVSRFCRDMGFASFEELREALAGVGRSFETASIHPSFEQRAQEHATSVATSLLHTAKSMDGRLVEALARDLYRFEKVSAFGMLKAQAAAMDLQADLLMLGKSIDTCMSYAEQVRRIAAAGADELVIIFSYTGAYFDARDLASSLARVNRPRIWMVAGSPRPQPGYVYGTLSFASDHSQLSHPFQLEMAEAIIAQEYARLTQ